MCTQLIFITSSCFLGFLVLGSWSKELGLWFTYENSPISYLHTLLHSHHHRRWRPCVLLTRFDLIGIFFLLRFIVSLFSFRQKFAEKFCLFLLGTEKTFFSNGKMCSKNVGCFKTKTLLLWILVFSYVFFFFLPSNHFSLRTKKI